MSQLTVLERREVRRCKRDGLCEIEKGLERRDDE